MEGKKKKSIPLSVWYTSKEDHFGNGFKNIRKVVRLGQPWKWRKHPGCGNIVTFAQFLFIAVEGFLFEADLGRKRPAIPIRYYAVMVTMFFTVSVVNNYALNLNIAMPLHMIFRSGSLIANMILGIIILKKRYSIFKYTSIALVSVGIFICTLMSAKQVTSESSSSENDGFQAFLRWLLGIGALTFALLMSARMGIFQETLYKQFGKHSKEALFYNHALPLPGFIFLASDIYDHAVLFNKSGVSHHHYLSSARVLFQKLSNFRLG
ncbi:nucleotide sugar transporter SLC35B4 isoform X4 [Canis aureus]